MRSSKGMSYIDTRIATNKLIFNMFSRNACENRKYGVETKFKWEKKKEKVVIE